MSTSSGPSSGPSSGRRAHTAMLLALALLSVAADCEQCQQVTDPRRGNVDRVADAVLIEGRDEHMYLVTTNPELEHLRVLDLTDERFLDGPNRFFPLSVPVGAATRRIAAAPDDEGFVFALDAGADRVFMVRTPAASSGDAWVLVGDPIPTANAPADLAVHKQDGSFVITLSLPDVGSVQRIVVDARAQVLADDTAVLAGAVMPDEVALGPDGEAVLVGDALGSAVHVLRAADGALVRSLDVGGPQGAIAVGVVDIGDGLAPVALVARRDAEEVWALRLYRPGFREDRYAVLGGTTVGGLPLSVFVNDVRDGKTVCCRGLLDESVERGEATSAFGGVALGSGAVLYVALAARGDGDRRVVRLIDDDPLALSQDAVDDSTLWVPGDGPDGEIKRPDPPEFRAVATTGDPPFWEAVDVDESLLLAWEGAPPGLRRIIVDVSNGVATAATIDLEARGARVDDRAVFQLEAPSAGCAERSLEARITAVAGLALTVALGSGAEALDEDDRLCLESSGTVRVSVEAREVFVATDSDGRFLGRLALTPRDGPIPPEGELALPGAVMTLRASAAGLPNHGARLAVPLDPHLVVLGLDLSEPVGRLGDGGFGTAGYLVQNILTRAMRYPNPAEDGDVIRARRMIITTGSADASGLNMVFSCDDAETLAGLCDSYR